MSRLDLILVGCAAVVGAVVGAIPELHPAIRAVSAVVLVCLLPGYALTAALHPEPTIGVAERAALTVGASLAVATLGAVLLNLGPAGIRAETWGALLASVTLTACLVAAYRSTRQVGGSRERGRAGEWRRSLRDALPPLGATGLAVLLSVVALSVAASAAREQNEPRLTQLWLVEAAEPTSMVVGIRNTEADPVVGRVVVWMGVPDTTLWDEAVAVPGGTEWEQTVPIGRRPLDEPVVAVLYRDADPDRPFRIARWWRP